MAEARRKRAKARLVPNEAAKPPAEAGGRQQRSLLKQAEIIAKHNCGMKGLGIIHFRRLTAKDGCATQTGCPMGPCHTGHTVPHVCWMVCSYPLHRKRKTHTGDGCATQTGCTAQWDRATQGTPCHMHVGWFVVSAASKTEGPQPRAVAHRQIAGQTSYLIFHNVSIVFCR